jgi:hypothetical protein
MFCMKYADVQAGCSIITRQFIGTYMTIRGKIPILIVANGGIHGLMPRYDGIGLITLHYGKE